MNSDALMKELRTLQDQVVGITDTAVATVDGMLVAANAGRIQPEHLAALAATTLGLAQRTTREVGGGAFRVAVTHCDSGYIAVYSVGDEALLVILADRNLNFARLHMEARGAVERVAAILFDERLVANGAELR